MPLRPGLTLDFMKGRGRDRLPGLFGFRLMAMEEGLLVAEIDIRPELLAPNGFLHAATVIALADTACGYGCIAHLPEGAENFTTVELKCNFLGTAREGTIFGTVVGLFIPAVLQAGFVIIGVQPFWQGVAVGSVLVAAVYVDQSRRAAALRGANSPSPLRALLRRNK